MREFYIRFNHGSMKVNRASLGDILKEYPSAPMEVYEWQCKVWRKIFFRL